MVALKRTPDFENAIETLYPRKPSNRENDLFTIGERQRDFAIIGRSVVYCLNPNGGASVPPAVSAEISFRENHKLIGKMNGAEPCKSANRGFVTKAKVLPSYIFKREVPLNGIRIETQSCKDIDDKVYCAQTIELSKSFEHTSHITTIINYFVRKQGVQLDPIVDIIKAGIITANAKNCDIIAGTREIICKSRSSTFAPSPTGEVKNK